MLACDIHSDACTSPKVAAALPYRRVRGYEARLASARLLFCLCCEPVGADVGECEVATGKVKWFNPQKGFGFIQPSSGGPDVFVHISAVERAGLSTLNDNQEVEYELQTGRNGKASAENLRVK